MIDEAIPTLSGASLLGQRTVTYVYLARCGDIDEQGWESTPADGDISVN
jgi:hypothetical protein